MKITQLKFCPNNVTSFPKLTPFVEIVIEGKYFLGKPYSVIFLVYFDDNVSEAWITKTYSYQNDTIIQTNKCIAYLTGKVTYLKIICKRKQLL
jgi:hypothetical protein